MPSIPPTYGSIKLRFKKNNFNMDEVISSLLKSKKKIGVFPVPNADWKDTGTWVNYLDTLKNKIY